MAVVQISRIQIRRGRKNQGSGLPQLASGEFGWAIDTQELYIGNGAVSEGAPYVGNTKILSEQDNLFEFAKNYTYKSKDGLIITGENGTVVTRDLQDRLDDRVSIRAFGGNGDGADQTSALQRAINELFLNPATVANPQSRVTLHVEAGTYTLSSTIYVPPFVTIVGAGVGKTIFNFTGTGPAFKTVMGTGSITFTSADYENAALLAQNTTLQQARNISLQGFTLNVASGQQGLFLDSCRNSLFSDIEIIGTRTLGTTPLDDDEIGILLESLSSTVTCKENTFKNISIKKLTRAIFSDYDIHNNVFDNMHFETLASGILFGFSSNIGSVGQLTGPYDNTIKNSLFRDIEKQAIYIPFGENNISKDNHFYLVGNDGGTNGNPVTPILEFTSNNASIGDWFERTAALGNNPNFIDTIVYIPEVKTETVYENNYTYKLTPFFSPSLYEKFIRLPADTERSFEIEYTYKSEDITRSGVWQISVDPKQNRIRFSDNYDLVAVNQIAELNHNNSLKFQVQGFSLGTTPTNPIDTLAIMMLNSTGEDSSFYYRVKTLV